MTWAVIFRFICTAPLMFCGTFSIGALAQERVVFDLALPPATLGDSALLRATSQRSNELTTAALASAAPSQTTRAPAQESRASNLPDTSVLRVKMRSGDSLARIFRRHDLDQADLLNMIRSSDALGQRLRRMRVGQQLSFAVMPGGKVKRLTLVNPGPTDVVIERHAADNFTMQTLADAPEPMAMHSLAQATAPAPAPAQDDLGKQQPVELQTTAKYPDDQAREKQLASSSTNPQRPQAATRSRKLTVKTGDSLYAIFNRERIPPEDLATLLLSGEPAAYLRHLRPGQTLTLDLSRENTLLGMIIEIDETRTFTAVRTDAGSFTSAVKRHPLERRVATASAIIENALFLAGQRAGLSDRLIMKMIEIFGWDVDFALDVRAGDRFTVVYEELYKDGEKVRDGKILAAEFNNRGRSIRAVAYTSQDGRAEYFSPEGFSMRKAFLRTPVNFSRISSPFDRGRMHPILQRMRAHNGVDYAAAQGTPVKAAGHGRVVSSGSNGGYGKTVVLQHGGTYTTLYAHLSKIHARARAGNRVKQGEIIGYVGATGLATGPHLHYEFRVHGVHKDPLRVTLPKALPIDQRYKDDFIQKTLGLVKQLDVLANTSIASSD